MPPSSGRISRLERYMALLQSSLLVDNDRRLIQTTAASTQAVGNMRWRNGLADSEDGECHITDEQFEPLVGRSETYRSPGPDALSLIPLWWMAMTGCFPDFSLMERGWLNMLFQRGRMVQNKKDKRQSGLVLFASKAGAVLWKLKRMDIERAKV